METLVRDFDLTEIINGEEIMGPSPFRKHQAVSANLFDIIRSHVKRNNLGKVYDSPLDVILEEGINRLQPDILFIKKENSDIEQDWIRGVPDMVCEIISQGTYKMDMVLKRAVYEKYKVPEYWIVLPELQAIEVLTIEGDRYKTYSIAEIEGMVQSKVIEGLQVNIKDAFED
ncbi:Uma2 family endonuclease [Candidatus Magnetominusculus xianensis]|uniref:Restriction endonuclease n=1 Tax=Candidatus Magnetominusculus xianensis TaxID=1748249 RepID=A0ABR5SJH3_9BACT|nr:Uma2 family endonuclease [Candidatus Magnetominusculus xianensis]KWT94633.1 restriction endonuclease [Candidatus Magnetominusculus xianensis]MBF0403345.1 Uma2 family endonuclease [Nitrospirota bacterium]